MLTGCLLSQEQKRTKAVEFCDGNENWEQDFQENGGKNRSTDWLEKKIRNIDTRLRREAEKQGGRTVEEITLDRDKSKSQFQSCGELDTNQKTLSVSISLACLFVAYSLAVQCIV